MSARLLNLIVLWLFVSLFANAVTWAWQGEVFMHEIGDHQHASFTTRMQQDHLHNEFTDHNNSSYFSTDICLKAAYQPFVFTKLSLLTPPSFQENLAKFIPPSIPESILDALFRPPRQFIYRDYLS